MFAIIRIYVAITTIGCAFAIRRTTTVGACILVFAEVAFLALILLNDAIAAERRFAHAAGHTAFTVGGVVFTVITDFAMIGRNDTVTAIGSFAFGRAGFTGFVRFAAFVAFFAEIGLNDSIAAVPFAGFGIAERIAAGIAVFTWIYGAVAALVVFVLAGRFVAAIIGAVR